MSQTAKISVYTPSHRPQFLKQAYESLKAQTETDWQWVVYINGLATVLWEEVPLEDPRVVIVSSPGPETIGSAKKAAVKLCEAPIMVELDHDDTLAPEALSEVLRAFKDHPEASLVFSNFAYTLADGSPNSSRHSSKYGWDYQKINGYLCPRPMTPTPHNVSHIWYAPNHLRAFPRWAYDKTRGYNEKLTCLDDQDLMSQLYQVGEFVGIDKLLYYQRFHGNNAQLNPKISEEIQKGTLEMYEETIFPNAVKWCERKKLRVINNDSIQLNRLLGYGFEKNSVGVIRIVDQLQDFDPEWFMSEAWLALAPNGLLLTLTPCATGRGAYSHPPRKSLWTQESFRRYTEGSAAKFQVSRLRTFYPEDWHIENNTPYVQANLIAVKPGYTRDGGLIDHHVLGRLNT